MLLTDKEFGPLIDRDAIAVAGHSYGANIAMLLAGAAVERDGKRISLAEARIKAAINATPSPTPCRRSIPCWLHRSRFLRSALRHRRATPASDAPAESLPRAAPVWRGASYLSAPFHPEWVMSKMMPSGSRYFFS